MATRRLLTDTDAEKLLRAMLVLSRTVQEVLEARLMESGPEPLSWSKIQILRLLSRRGRHTSTQLAHFLGVSKPAVTQIVSSLLEKKLIRRVQTGEDRRAFSVELTRRGERVLDRVHEEERHLVRAAWRRSKRRDPKVWIQALDEVSGALALADEDFEDFCCQCQAYADGTCVLVRGGADCLFAKGST